MSECEDVELTQRERDILVLVCRGLSNPKIAERLSVSVSTVNNSLHQILNKLGATNRGQAVIASLKRGLTDPLDIYSVEEWVDFLVPPVPEQQMLTPRERQMLILYAWGLSNQEVADALSISLSAVKGCVRHLYKKVGAANRIDAIMIGFRQGHLNAWDFLSPDDAADIAVVAGPQVVERLIASLGSKLNTFDSDDLSFRPYMRNVTAYLQRLVYHKEAKKSIHSPPSTD
jgi:DNA-binding CsgD family transcriptional regulator